MTEKIRENRLRRVAVRQGLGISKSRRRDSRAVDFGKWFVFDLQTNGLMSSEHGIDLDDVEAFLAG